MDYTSKNIYFPGMSEYKIGIALGGGGARGFAHLGALAALEEKGIKPDVISGVSAGSLVGVFLASGKSPNEVMKLMKENDITDYAKITMPVNGLLNLGNLENILNDQIDVDQIEELELPFIITVSNMFKGEVEYVKEGPIVDYVTASASIPVLFSPVEINKKLYSDGGLFDNLPIEPLKECCEKVIAISISPVQEINKLDNLVEMAARTFQLAVNNHRSEIEEHCDLFIEPKGLEKFGILDTSNADQLFEIGYDHVKGMKNDLLS